MNKAVLNLIALFCIELIIFLPICFVDALTISNVDVTDITAASAKINWKTDAIADGVVNYGKTTGLGSEKRHSTYMDEHSLILTSLQGNTNYYFKITSNDLNGTAAVDDNSGNFYTFKTLDTTAPGKVSGLTAGEITEVSVKLNWSSNIESDIDKYIVYRNNVIAGETKETAYIDTGLSSSTSYSYKVSAVDTSGNEGIKSDAVSIKTLAPDTNSPQITNLMIAEMTNTQATIKWSTDEESTSVLEYGEDESTDYRKESSSLLKNHSITITNLVNGEKYSYIASSCDKSNNCASSQKESFFAGQDITPPYINTDIPRYYNERRIDIKGATEPYSIVRLYVNDLSTPERALDKNAIGEKGEFEFKNVYLEDENIIEIWAKDNIGNVNYSLHHVSLDLSAPDLQIEELPDVTNSKNITIKGSVNEESTINFYADIGGVDNTAPEKVTGLKNLSLGSNLIEITWDESPEDDIDSYIVYREDIGPIAMTKKGYNSYPDYLVDSDKEYTYKVAAMDTSGNIGSKSDPLAMKTQPGGRLNVTKPEAVNATIPEKIKASINTTGAFAAVLKITKGDGTYHLKIEAVDKAANTAVIEKEFTIDTTPPKIKITSPKPGANIYEHFADDMDIEGETEKNAEVHLYIERTPFGCINDSLDVSGLQIQDIPESELMADCRVPGTSLCPTGADFSTKADQNGTFKFENIDLTSWLGIGASTKEVPYSALSTQWDLGCSRSDKERARILFISTDETGQRAVEKVDYRVVTCWSGNFSWDITPLTEGQSPTFLSTNRIAKGEEYIYFFLRFDYGGSDEAEIPSGGITITSACQGYTEVDDERYKMACELLDAGAISTILNEDRNVAYITVKLKKIQGMDEWLEDDWDAFVDAVSKELTFPFKVTINYKHKSGSSASTETQTTCAMITYDLDYKRIDWKSSLPDWLLEDGVDFLNDTLTQITKIQKEIDKVVRYVAIVCVASFFIKAATAIYRNYVCTADSIKKWIDRFTGQEEQRQKCASCLNTQYPGKTPDSVKMDEMSDTCLVECFPSCSTAWKSEEYMYKIFRLSCDRLFGHKTPSRWTETVTDDKLNTIANSGKGCDNDQSVLGRSLKARNCGEFFEKYTGATKYDYYDKCFEVSNAGTSSTTLYRLSDPVQGSSLYQLQYINGPYELTNMYAIKQTEEDFLTSQGNECSQVCNTKKGVIAKNQFIVNSKSVKGQLQGNMLSACIPAKECDILAGGEGQTVTDKDGKKIEVKYAVRMGYTKDCFYGQEPFYDVKVVSDNDETRIECCCVSTEKPKEGLTNYKYYLPKDVESNADPPGEPGTNVGENPTNYQNMKWSYRYSKIKYEVKDGTPIRNEYNPNRYISGRDWTACFGQNNWFYDGFGAKDGKGNLLIIDPLRQFTSAFQCLNIGGINNRLQRIANILFALENCLIQIRTVGYADAGVCKEQLNKHLCGFLWEIISYLREGCLPLGIKINYDESEDNMVNQIKRGVTSVYKGISESQADLINEYDNAKLTNLVGMNEEEVTRKICLAAFGYDWDISLRDIMDVAYSQPMETFVLALFPSREFLSVNPETGDARYEYTLGWTIDPGCDMDRYEVYLSCVSNNEIARNKGIDCSKVQDPEGIGCDCENRPNEVTKRLGNVGGKLTQNSLEDQSYSDIIPDKYRYDHLKFVLKPHKDISRGVTASDKDNAKYCFGEGYYQDGQGVYYFPIHDKTAYDIIDCNVDPTTGTFGCTSGLSFWSQKGTGYFSSIDLVVNGLEEPLATGISVYESQRVEIQPTIYHMGPRQCFVYSINNGKEGILDIDINGTHKYAPIEITDNVKLGEQKSDTVKLLECKSIPTTTEEKSKDCDEKQKQTNLYIEVIQKDENERKITIKLIDNNSNGIIDITSNSEDKLEVNKLEKGPISSWYNQIIEDGKVQFKINSIDTHSGIQQIKYEVTIPGTKAPRDTETWSINYGLYYRKHNDTQCEFDLNINDPVKYQGKSQTFTAAIYAKSKSLMPVGAYYNCKKDGTAAETTSCNCDGDIYENENEDCDLSQGRVYCYSGSCKKFPKCKDNAESAKYTCDCNGDGDIDDTKSKEDCTKDNQYCYDLNGVRGCHTTQKS